MNKKLLLFLLKYTIKKILTDPSLLIVLEREARKTKTDIDDKIIEFCKVFRKLI